MIAPRRPFAVTSRGFWRTESRSPLLIATSRWLRCGRPREPIAGRLRTRVAGGAPPRGIHRSCQRRRPPSVAAAGGRVACDGSCSRWAGCASGHPLRPWEVGEERVEAHGAQVNTGKPPSRTYGALRGDVTTPGAKCRGTRAPSGGRRPARAAPRAAAALSGRSAPGATPCRASAAALLRPNALAHSPAASATAA